MPLILILLAAFLSDSSTATDCVPCESTDLNRAFASSDLIVIAKASGTPSLRQESKDKNEKVFTELSIEKVLFQSDDLNFKKKKLSIRANSIECHSGLILPPKVPFLLFFRNSPTHGIDSLICKGPELLVEKGKVQVAGKAIKPEALIKKLKVSAKSLRDRTRRKKSADKLPRS